MKLTELEHMLGTKVVVRRGHGGYQVKFPRAEVKIGSCLHGTAGHGKTITAAKNDYARELSGCKELVFNAHSSSRRSFNLPRVITHRKSQRTKKVVL